MTLAATAEPFRPGKRAAALLVTEYFPPVTGGVARWHDVVIRNARRFDWIVVTRPAPGAAARETRGDHLILRPAWWRTEPSLLKLGTLDVYRRLHDHLDELVRRARPETIHAAPVHGAAFAAQFVARRRGLPLVVHVFGEEFGMEGRSLHRRLIMRAVLSRARAIMAISEATRARAIAFGAPAERTAICIAPDLANLGPRPRAEARARLGLEGDPLLLTVSRVVERKGHDLVIRAVAELAARHPGLRYHVAGEGPDLERIRGLASSLGIASRVVFLGQTPEENLADLYAAADLFVMPNRELPSGELEGFGLVFVEAGACGTPSIGGRSGGSASAIIDGRTGLLVAPDDPGELVAAIDLLLGDTARREAMGAAALEFARREFDNRAVVDRLERLHLENP